MRSVIAFVLIMAGAAYAEPPAAKISDLAWMTGNWAGQLGPNRLEERWNPPMDGSIQSLVRMTGSGATSMVELIVIDEVDGSLELRIQQWDPGMKPRTAEPLVMELVEIGERMVSFRAPNGGFLDALKYSSPDESSFVVTVQPQGSPQTMDLPLKATTP